VLACLRGASPEGESKGCDCPARVASAIATAIPVSTMIPLALRIR